MNIVQELLDKFWNYPKTLKKGNQAFVAHNLGDAQKYYQKTVAHLAKRTSLDKTKKRYLGEAYLGLGNICHARKEHQLAVDFFSKALDSTIPVSNLPDDAIILLGATLCDKKDQTERAIEIYLRYIKPKPQGNIANKIYSILEGLCFVNEKQASDVRKKALSLNQRVLPVNPDIEWTYYYLGVGEYVENDKANAQKHLLNAVKLDAKRALSYYWLGKIFDELKQVEPAEKHFLKFLDLIPDDKEQLKQSEAFLYLGTALIQSIGGFSDDFDLSIKDNQAKLEKAVGYFNKASSKNERDDVILFSLAKALSLLKMHEQAISAYKKAIGITRKNSEYYYLLAVELKKLQRHQDAIKSVVSAVSIDDQDKYHQLLAVLYLLTGNYSASENECLKIYGKDNVHNSEIFCLLTYALYEQHKYASIADICEKFPGSSTCYNEYPDTYFYIARAYSHVAKFGKATAWYIKDIRTKERAAAVYYLGCALSNKGDYEKALTAFDRIISKEMEYQPLAYLQRGLIYSKLDQSKNAEVDFIKAYSIAPENIDILYSIGRFYYLEGDVEQALKYMSELPGIDWDHFEARFIRGHIHEKQGDIESAINEYTSLLANLVGEAGYMKVWPGTAIYQKFESPFDHDCSISQCRLRLGILYFKKSDYTKALGYLQAANSSANKSDSLLFYHGLLCALNNNFKLALQSWNELSGRHPDDERLKANIYRVHYLLGCRYIKENKFAEAIEEWKEYLKGYNEDARTKKCIAELYFRLFAEAIKAGSTQKARELVLQAAAFDDGTKKYVFYAALCDCKLDQFDECIKKLDNITDSEMSVSRTKYHQGVAFMKQGQKDLAMQIFNDLADSMEDERYSSHSKWLLANECIVKGQYDRAIPILEALRC